MINRISNSNWCWPVSEKYSCIPLALTLLNKAIEEIVASDIPIHPTNRTIDGKINPNTPIINAEKSGIPTTKNGACEILSLLSPGLKSHLR